MKSIQSILIISLLLFFPFSVFAQWITHTQIKENTLDAAHIWATSEDAIHWVGEASAKVAKSTDGGKNWTTQTLPGDAGIGTFARDMHFISANTGFIVGAINVGEFCIWRTDNGGDSWSLELLELFDAFGSLRSIHFIDPLNGFIVGSNNTALKTIDGGQNWTEISIDITPTSNFVAVDFIDKNTGFIASSNFTFSRTFDGGLTWETNETSIFWGNSEIQFFDAHNGFGLERDNGLYKTKDGGKSWDLVKQFPGFKGTMWWQNDQIGYVSTRMGEIYKTIDGGAHWSLQNMVVEQIISDFFFLTPTLGWAAVGDDSGSILKTTNGGGIGLNIGAREAGVCLKDTLFLEANLISNSTIRWELNGEFYSNEPNPIFIPRENGTFEFKAIIEEGNQLLSELYEFTPIYVPLDESIVMDRVFDTVCAGSIIDLNFSGVNNNANYRLEINGEIFEDEQNPISRRLEWTIDSLTENINFSVRKYDLNCGWVEQLGRKVAVVEPPLANLELVTPRSLVCARDTANIIILNAQKGVGYQVFSEGRFRTGVLTATQDADFSLSLNRQVKTVNYTVQASRSKGCTRLIEDSVSIEVINLFPSFSVEALNVPIDSPMTIHNTSPDSLTFKWTMSNGTSSMDMHPNPVTFSEEKEQSIHLEVSSPFGCKETVTKTINMYDSAMLSDFWLQKEGPTRVSNLHLWNMQIDKQGSIYYAYNFDHLNDDIFDINTHAGEAATAFDEVIIKKDKKGVLQWYSEINSVNEATFSVNDFALSPTNNLIALISHVGVINIQSTDGNHYESADQRGMLIIEFRPSGVIHKVHQLTNVAPPSNQLRRDYSSGLSVEMDQDGAIFITGRWYYSVTNDELIYTNPEGIQSTINSLEEPAFSNDGIGFFVAKIDSAETVSWAKSYFHSAISGRVRQLFRPVEIRSDKLGGIYLWATGFKEDNRAEYFHKVILTKVDSMGKDVWNFSGTMEEDWDKDRYMLAHNLEVDEQGNAFLLGTVYGANRFTSHRGTQTVLGQFLAKVNTNGKIEWLRYLNTASQQDGLDNINTFGLGLAIDNGLIYVRSKKCSWKTLRVFPVCHNPSENDEEDQNISIWDMDGNLLQIIPVHNTGCSSISHNMHPTIFDVKDEAMYLLGDVSEMIEEIVEGFPNENTSKNNYLARIEDNKAYYPFITRPFDNIANCHINLCEYGSEELSVSNVFTNIKWLVDGFLIRFQPTSVRVQEAEVPKIIQEGEFLAVRPSQSYYYWYDATTDELLSSGSRLEAGRFRPKIGETYYFRGYDGNCLVPTDTFSIDAEGMLITSLRETIQFSSLNIYPNPTNNLVTISFNPINYQKHWQISIFNVLNQQVFLKPIEINNGSAVNFSYNVQDLARGLYHIVLQSEDQQEIALGKLVVIK